MREAIWSARNGCLKLEIFHDDCGEDPRQWDNLGMMVCWHRRYALGDKHDFKEPKDFLDSNECKNASVILPLYLYDHSGITMNTTGFSCPWDSGQVGWIYVTKEKVREEFKCKRISKKLQGLVKNALIVEVKEYDSYISGEVYGFVASKGEEEVDSCWGFFGSDWDKNGLKETVPREFKSLVKEL